jgi:5-(carboxyamino)imidazole ribonucleotide synthase
MQTFYQDLRLGVLGGGQLGRMLIQAAIDFNLHIRVLDPSAEAPCRPYAHHFEQGSLTDYDTVYRFGQQVDLLTIEIEHVNTEALEALQAEGKLVYPDPKTIRLIQDKRLQKQFFLDHGFPTSPFRLVENRAEVFAARDFLPAVNKLGQAGYDGRGVQILRSEADLELAFDAPGLVERFVPFEKEIAVLVGRNPQGDTAVFSVVEMVFHPAHNLVEYLFAPAEMSIGQAQQAQEMAIRLAQQLNYVGIMAVEMFLTAEGQLLINEVAPRPHNSGHHTIRACLTSQYEQHLRAILGLPLGNPAQKLPAAMVNLLGEAGCHGKTHYLGLEEAMSISGVYPHLYGKAETRPFRKMGHVTLLDPDRDELREKIARVRNLIKVVSATESV